MNLQIVSQTVKRGPKNGKRIVQIFDFDVSDTAASILFPHSFKTKKAAQAAFVSPRDGSEVKSTAKAMPERRNTRCRSDS